MENQYNESEYNENEIMLEKLYKRLEKETNKVGLGIVRKIVQVEIEQEKFCNI